MRVAGYNQYQRLFQSFEIRLDKLTKTYRWNLSSIVQLEFGDVRGHESAIRKSAIECFIMDLAGRTDSVTRTPGPSDRDFRISWKQPIF